MESPQQNTGLRAWHLMTRTQLSPDKGVVKSTDLPSLSSTESWVACCTRAPTDEGGDRCRVTGDRRWEDNRRRFRRVIDQGVSAAKVGSGGSTKSVGGSGLVFK